MQFPLVHCERLDTVRQATCLPFKGGDWSKVDQMQEDGIAAVNILDSKGYRRPYGLTLPPTPYNDLFRRCAGTNLLQIEHLKRLCTRDIVKATTEGGVIDRSRCRPYRARTGNVRQ